MSEIGCDDHPRLVVGALGAHIRSGRAFDDVIHARGHQQAARARGMRKPAGEFAIDDPLRPQRSVNRCRCARVTFFDRDGLIGNQLGLDHHPKIGIRGLDLVQHRRGRALDQ